MESVILVTVSFATGTSIRCVRRIGKRNHDTSDIDIDRGLDYHEYRDYPESDYPEYPDCDYPECCDK